MLDLFAAFDISYLPQRQSIRYQMRLLEKSHSGLLVCILLCGMICGIVSAGLSHFGKFIDSEIEKTEKRQWDSFVQSSSTVYVHHPNPLHGVFRYGALLIQFCLPMMIAFCLCEEPAAGKAYWRNRLVPLRLSTVPMAIACWIAVVAGYFVDFKTNGFVNRSLDRASDALGAWASNHISPMMGAIILFSFIAATAFAFIIDAWWQDRKKRKH